MILHAEDTLVANLIENADDDRDKGNSSADKLKKFSETRWTLRHMGHQRVSDNSETSCDMWDDTLSEEKGLNSDVNGRMIGVNASSRTFDFLFFLELGLLIYGQTDALSQTTQAERMNLLCGKQLCNSTLSALLGDRTEEMFKLFTTRC